MAEIEQGTAAGSEAGQGQGGSSAGSENTESQSHMIPKGRFDEVIGQRNELNRKLSERDALIQEMDSRLKSLESRKAEPEIVEPLPEDATAEQRADYMIRMGVNKYAPKLVEQILAGQLDSQLKEKLGNVDEFKQTMGANLQEAQRGLMERYEAACKSTGIDGSNKSVRSMIAAYARENNTGPEESVQGVVKLLGISKGGSQSSAEMLSDTLTGATMAPDAHPKSFQESWDLAKEGKIATSATDDVLDILKSIDKR